MLSISCIKFPAEITIPEKEHYLIDKNLQHTCTSETFFWSIYSRAVIKLRKQYIKAKELGIKVHFIKYQFPKKRITWIKL